MRASPYWQHVDPLKCPKGHPMVWLGSVYWICAECPKKSNRLWVDTSNIKATPTPETTK